MSTCILQLFVVTFANYSVIIIDYSLTSSMRQYELDLSLPIGYQKKCTWMILSKDSLTGQVEDMQVSLQSSDPNVIIPQPLVTIRVNNTMAGHLNTGKIEVNNTIASPNTGKTANTIRK